jgi:hypothetical protein
MNLLVAIAFAVTAAAPPVAVAESDPGIPAQVASVERLAATIEREIGRGALTERVVGDLCLATAGGCAWTGWTECKDEASLPRNGPTTPIDDRPLPVFLTTGHLPFFDRPGQGR